MAVIKHIAIKNSNYDAAYDYLTTKHDEFTNKPILDENGKRIPRENEDGVNKADVAREFNIDKDML